jgi:hypothetical protein
MKLGTVYVVQDDSGKVVYVSAIKAKARGFAEENKLSVTAIENQNLYGLKTD